MCTSTLFILPGLRENVWNLHNCRVWARVCRYRSRKNGAVDRPTLHPLGWIQNKKVSAAQHVPAPQKIMPGSRFLGREWLCFFLTADFTNRKMNVLLSVSWCSCKRIREKNGKFVFANIKLQSLNTL